MLGMASQAGQGARWSQKWPYRPIRGPGSVVFRDRQPQLDPELQRAPFWPSWGHSPRSEISLQSQTPPGPCSGYLGAATSWARPVAISWPIFPRLTVPTFAPFSQGDTKDGAATYRWVVHTPVLEAAPGEGWRLGREGAGQGPGLHLYSRPGQEPGELQNKKPF